MPSLLLYKYQRTIEDDPDRSRPKMADHKPKLIFQLDTPFTSAQWPNVLPQDQEDILELLCSLLSPIGLHRSNHIKRSKGKREKKRKRQIAKTKDGATSISPIPSPPSPEIASFVVVGLNSITRELEALSKQSKPTTNVSEPELPAIDPSKHFSAIFALKSYQPPILNSHLPQLIQTASFAHPDLPATRLVELPKGCDPRLCEALGLSRVSFIGILHDAPHSKALIERVQQSVAEMEISWIEHAKTPIYRPVKINAIETFQPPAKQDQKAS